MTRSRRRGNELEAAVYSAARQILKDKGFAELTFANVATLAQTSKPVIYRHWESPFELALLAIQDQIEKDNEGTIEQLKLTGDSLQEDLLQTLMRFRKSMDAYGQAFLNTYSDLNEAYTTQLQSMLISFRDADIHAINKVLTRAQARNEIARTDLDDMITMLPFDWIRIQYLYNQPVDDAMLTKFVATVLMPAYTSALNAE